MDIQCNITMLLAIYYFYLNIIVLRAAPKWLLRYHILTMILYSKQAEMSGARYVFFQ